MSVLKHKEDGQWKQVSNATQTKYGSVDPTTATVAESIGQPYLNITSGNLFMCTSISSGVYTWIPVGGNCMEKVSNKQTSISSSSTDTQYPSAKAVYDYVQSQINTHITSKIAEEY